jgi:hypothetical protein
VTKIGMELIERIDKHREAQGAPDRQAEAMVAEWTAPADVDAVLDFYNRLVDTIQGRVSKASGVREVERGASSRPRWPVVRDGARAGAAAGAVPALRATDRPVAGRVAPAGGAAGRPSLPPASAGRASAGRAGCVFHGRT